MASTQNNVKSFLAPTAEFTPTPVLEPGDFAFDQTTSELFFVNPTRALVAVGGAASPSIGWFSVKDYGAKGDGATDDTAAIQAAADAMPATGGVLYFPPGYYFISAAIVLDSYMHVLGAGRQAVRIRQTVASQNAFTATDTLHVTVEHLTVIGPGGSTGIGFHFIYVAQVTSYLKMNCVNVQTFGGSNIKLDRSIETSFDTVVSQASLSNGFELLDGTSANFINCFALSCNQAGFYLNSMNYCSFTGTASDNNGLGYRFIGCRTIAMNGCGVEASRNLGATYNGTGLVVDSSIAMTINSFENVDNAAVGFLVTNTSTGITFIGLRENAPTVAATVSLQVDSGSTVALINPILVTAPSYAVGTTRFLTSTTFVIKTADEVVNNSNVLQNDDILVGAVSASGTYLVEVYAIYDSAAAADIQFAFIGPAGATMDWTTNALGTAAAGSTGSITVGRSSLGAGGVLPAGGIAVGTQLIANLKGILIVGATAGTLQLQWSQATADPTNTTVRARSWMRLIRVA